MLRPGYKRVLIIRDVVFNECEMANLVHNKMLSSNEKVETPDPEIETDCELKPNEYTSIHENHLHSSGQSTYDDYNLIRDRAKRVIKPPERFFYADLISYALLVSENLDDLEPRDYKEA